MNIPIFILGLFLGSFLNSFIWRWRVNNLKSIVTERSVCPECKHVLSTQDLMPLLSFIVLGGQCRYCGKPISWQYPMVELFFALLTLLLYWQTGPGIVFVLSLIIAFLLTALMVIDILDGVLPNMLNVWAMIAILFLLIFSQYTTLEWFNSIIAALVGFGFFIALWLVTLGRGVGVGDIKLALVLGLLVGTPGVYYLIMLSFVIGAIYVLPLILIGKTKWKQKIAFGPFMILAYYLVYFLGEEMQVLVERYL